MQLKPITAIIVLSLVVASLLVAGCTSSTQNTSSTSGGGGHMSIAAAAVTAPTVIDKHSPNQGDKFVMYNTTVTNVDARDRLVTYGSIKVKDSNNYSYGALSWQNTAVTFPITTTQPGDKVNGLIVFEVPQNAKITTMVYDDHQWAGNNYQGNVTIKLAGGSNAASSTTGSIPTTPSAQPTLTPSGSPSSNPSLIPSPTPTPTASTQPVTGSFGQSSYVEANGTVVTATVSNWASNPSVVI